MMSVHHLSCFLLLPRGSVCTSSIGPLFAWSRWRILSRLLYASLLEEPFSLTNSKDWWTQEEAMKRHSAVQHSIYKGDVYVYIYIYSIYIICMYSYMSLWKPKKWPWKPARPVSLFSNHGCARVVCRADAGGWAKVCEPCLELHCAWAERHCEIQQLSVPLVVASCS